MKRIVVLISGQGSNLDAIVRASEAQDWPGRVVAVISNRAEARGLQSAQAHGIATEALDHKAFADRPAFDAALADLIDRHAPDLVVLAGFMRILTPMFVELWRDAVINIHPSLLPSFRGLDTHRQALEAGVRFHGCTVHIVRPDLDDGPILVQAAVPVLPDDDEQSLAARVLEAEHQAYPLALRLIAERRVTVEGRRVRISGGTGPVAAALINPAS